MTNHEHLLENAISAISTTSFEDWVISEKRWYGTMYDESFYALIWELAQYVVYSYTPAIKLDTIEQMEKLYGYRLVDYIV